MLNTDYLEEYRNGNRARITVSIAAKDERMTAAELTEILTGDFADKIGYRRAIRHPNAPVALVKKLAKDGEFLDSKCLVYHWEEATTDELHVGAKWMCENDSYSYIAAYYVEHPNISEKTLRHLYNHCEDGGYLWKALVLNPNTPDNIRANIQTRKNMVQIRDLENKIAALKNSAEPVPEPVQQAPKPEHQFKSVQPDTEQSQEITMGGMY